MPFAPKKATKVGGAGTAKGNKKVEKKAGKGGASKKKDKKEGGRQGKKAPGGSLR